MTRKETPVHGSPRSLARRSVAVGVLGGTVGVILAILCVAWALDAGRECLLAARDGASRGAARVRRRRVLAGERGAGKAQGGDAAPDSGLAGDETEACVRARLSGVDELEIENYALWAERTR